MSVARIGKYIMQSLFRPLVRINNDYFKIVEESFKSLEYNRFVSPSKSLTIFLK